MRREYLVFLILVSFACRDNRKGQSKETIDKKEKYYEMIPDAPLDLYCYLNSSLDGAVRLQLCSLIVQEYSNNLTLNVVLSIQGGKLDQVKLHSLYFDSAGNANDDSISVNSLNKIFNSMEITDIPTLRAIQDEDLVLRMQLERFCHGYVFMNETEISRRMKTRK